jgi:hypothetical protein
VAEPRIAPPAPSLTETINLALRAHQENSDGWSFKAAAADLHGWGERMIIEFKLEIGIPCLLIEHLSRRYGHYRPKRNGFGLADEIGLDRSHVQHSPYWRVLGTLLHELLHSWQAHHGTPGCRNYHNQEFQQKAWSLGLVIDSQGYTKYAAGDTPFFRLLKKFGIETPEDPNASGAGSPPTNGLSASVGSKLKLYACGCGVKVRVGRARFNAQCLDCGGVFVLKEVRGARLTETSV